MFETIVMYFNLGEGRGWGGENIKVIDLLLYKVYSFRREVTILIYTCLSLVLLLLQKCLEKLLF